MNLRTMGRTGLLPLVLGVMACSDMDPGEDTFRIVYPNLVNEGGSGGDGPVGNAGSGGSAGDSENPPDGSLLDTEDWSCLRNSASQLMVPRGNNPTRIQYRVPVVDFDTLTAVPGIIVEPCITSNCDVYPTCAAGSTPAPTEACVIVTPPAPGSALFVIDFPYNFTGGLKITKPGEYAEMDYFFGGPLVGLPEAAPSDGGNIVVGQGIPVLKTTARERAYEEVGVTTVDPTRGTLAVRTLSCRRTPPNPPAGMTPAPQGQRAAGVSLEAIPEVPEGSSSWALSNGNVFSRNKLETDGRGVAGFLNAPPVITEVRAVLPDGTVYGRTSIRVRADVITLAELRPGLDLWGQ